MDAVTYVDDKVARVVGEKFVAAKLELAKSPEEAKRLGAYWTPTILFLEGGGREVHRSVGFLAPEEFKPHLDLALGKATLMAGRFDDAAKQFDHVGEHHAKAEAAAEALYWSGVAKYRATQQKEPLLAAWNAILDRYPQSGWALRVGFLRK